jgi:hypothetical protein
LLYLLTSDTRDRMIALSKKPLSKKPSEDGTVK